MIINPRVGDKVMSSNTDAKLNEYRLSYEQNMKDKMVAEDNGEPSVCSWHFYEEKKNDALHQIGYRLKLTHHKVI